MDAGLGFHVLLALTICRARAGHRNLTPDHLAAALGGVVAPSGAEDLYDQQPPPALIQRVGLLEGRRFRVRLPDMAPGHRGGRREGRQGECAGSGWVLVRLAPVRTGCPAGRRGWRLLSHRDVLTDGGYPSVAPAHPWVPGEQGRRRGSGDQRGERSAAAPTPPLEGSASVLSWPG